MQFPRFLQGVDGLDEVPVGYQELYIAFLNEYRNIHKGPMAVCSRKEEYLSQPVQLHLRTTILMQPLTRQQVDDYLQGLGEEVASLQVALRKSSTLQQLA